MKKKNYIPIIMAPLSMLALFACTPNQIQQTNEYDDVYFTTSDRTKRPTILETSEEVIATNEKAFILGDYSTEKVDPTLISKYNNGESKDVYYFEETAKVTRATNLNYSDFIWDYENQNLAYYELPLDWNSDWDERSFNRLMASDLQFQLAWYDQYYLGNDARMNSYTNVTNRRTNRSSFRNFNRPNVGFNVGFSSFGFSPFSRFGMNSIGINSYGFRDPFFDPFWGQNRFYDPFWGFNSFYCPPMFAGNFGNPWGWNRGNGWRNGGFNNIIVANNVIIDNGNNIGANDRQVIRSGRISSTTVSSVRADAVNGSAPSTRSSRLTSSANTRSSESSTNATTSTRSRSAVSNGRSSRVSTNAYEFGNSNQSTRSSNVRNNGVRSTNTRSNSSTVRTTAGRASSSLFSRSSSSRTNTPTYSRSTNSRSSSSSSRGGVSSSSSRSNSSRSSNSRSSGSVGSSSSRSSGSGSSRSSGSSGSSSRGSSSSSSSRSGRGN
jgi:hypothetical protein